MISNRSSPTRLKQKVWGIKNTSFLCGIYCTKMHFRRCKDVESVKTCKNNGFWVLARAEYAHSPPVHAGNIQDRSSSRVASLATSQVKRFGNARTAFQLHCRVRSRARARARAHNKALTSRNLQPLTLYPPLSPREFAILPRA